MDYNYYAAVISVYNAFGSSMGEILGVLHLQDAESIPNYDCLDAEFQEYVGIHEENLLDILHVVAPYLPVLNAPFSFVLRSYSPMYDRRGQELFDKISEAGGFAITLE